MQDDEDQQAYTLLYEHAVEHPCWDMDSAADALGLPVYVIEQARERLLRDCLLQPSLAGGLVAVAPDLAEAALVHDDEERIRELSSAVAAARQSVNLMLPAFTRAKSLRGDAAGGVEVVEDPDTVRRVIRHATRECWNRAYIMRPNLTLRAEALRASASYDRELLARGVERRNIVHEASATHAATLRNAHELIPLGVGFRLLPVVPLQALLFDDNLAIVSRQAHPDDRAALVLRDPALVTWCFTVFKSLWEVASAFPDKANENAAPVESELTDVQRSILRGLAAGSTDESIARQLGIHVRTLRRHLVALHEDLGAVTRFQVALRARERGWI